MAVTHLTSRQVFGIFIEVINVGAERLEVRDDKLLPEGLGEQNDVALDTPGTGDDPKRSGLRCGSASGLWVGEFRPQLTHAYVAVTDRSGRSFSHGYKPV